MADRTEITLVVLRLHATKSRGLRPSYHSPQQCGSVRPHKNTIIHILPGKKRHFSSKIGASLWNCSPSSLHKERNINIKLNVSELPTNIVKDQNDDIDCWRVPAGNKPILYNSEKKPKFVGCKIGDMRSRLRFLYPGCL